MLESQVAEKQVVGVQRVKTFRPQWHVMLNLKKQFNPPEKAVQGTTIQPGSKTPGLNFDPATTAGIPCAASNFRIGRKRTTSAEFVLVLESQVAEQQVVGVQPVKTFRPPWHASVQSAMKGIRGNPSLFYFPNPRLSFGISSIASRIFALILQLP